MKPTISKPFKSNDRTFEKVFGLFNKKDYFNVKGLAKVQIGNFERALQKNDKNAQQVLDMFKGDDKKAKEYIIQVIHDRKKEQAFNDYKALKDAVDSIQKGKPNVGAVDYVKRIIHNNNQKYSIALYSAISGKRINNYKDIHKDIDSLVGETLNELSDKDTKKANLLRTNMPGYIGTKFAKKASDEDILAMAKLKDQKAKIYNRYVKVVDDAITKLQKKYRIKESVNEAYLVLYSPKKGVKPVSTAAYKDKKDAEKWAKDLGGVTMIVKKKVKGIDEGKKRYNVMYGVGSSKYTVNFHDGKSKHKDGSDFFDIAIFKNKRDLAKKINDLTKQGYIYAYNESLNESKTKESKVVQMIYKYAPKEKKFYDKMAEHERRIGQRDYAKFIIMALKGFGINPRQYKRIPDAEEKLYQTVSKK